MKTLKALLLLTPTALLALASCGAPAESSSSSSIFSSEESKTSATSSKEADTSISSSHSEESKTGGENVSSEESVSSEEESLPEVTEYKVPTTEKEYFQQLNRATKASEEANDIRIYTPHANVKRKIDKNGYASAQFGMHLDLDAKSSEAQEIMSELKMGDEVSLDFSINAKKVPFDYCDINRKAEDTSTRQMSFVNEIENDISDIQITFAFGGRSISSPSSLYTSIHLKEDLLFVDLSGIDAYYSLLTSNHLPGNGRMSFDTTEPEQILEEIVDGIKKILDEKKEGGEEASNEESSSEEGLAARLAPSLPTEIDIESIIESVKNLCYDLYTYTKNSDWKFEDNAISLSIQGEDQLKTFLVDLFKGSNKDYKEADLKTYQDNIDDMLSYMEFDHISTLSRFNEKGLDYTNFSFLISSFDKDKFLSIKEAEDAGVHAYPTGSMGLYYGLAYDYENIVPDSLTTKEMVKYEMIDSETVITKILDLIRSLIPVGIKF